MSGATSATALSSLALGSSVASLGSGVVGSYYGAKAQKSHLNFQASIADINARIAELGGSTGATTRPARGRSLDLGCWAVKRAAACGLGCQWD